MVYFSDIIWWFSFPEIYPVSGFFRISFKSSDFSSLNASLLIKYDIMVFFPVNFPDFRIFLNFPGFSSSLHISMFLAIFLQITDSLFIKYDMIFFSGSYPVFGFSLVFFWILWFWLTRIKWIFFGFYRDFYTFKPFIFIKVYSAHEVGL